MGFDHMALVRQNTPYITRSGDFQRMDLEFLLMIAEKIPASRETPKWFMTMEEIKHALRMKPETRGADIIRIYKHVVKLGYLKVLNGKGRGRTANTYILTDTIMKGHVAPKRKPKADTGHVCDCEGKSHSNDAACRQYRSYQKKKGKKPKAENVTRVTKPARAGKAAAPTPASKPPTEAELQARAEATAAREEKFEAERQKKRKQEAEAQRIENVQHEDVCIYPLKKSHMTLEDCKRIYGPLYQDGSKK